MNKLKEHKFILTILVLVIYLIFVLYVGSIDLTMMNFLGYVIFLAILLLIYRNDLIKNWKEYKHDKKRVKTIIIYFIIVFLLSSIVSNIVIKGYMELTGSTQIIDSSNSTIYSMFDKVPWGTLFVVFLTVFFYPIVEELVFRKSMGDALKPTILFIIISSLLSWYFQVTLLNPSGLEFVLAIGVLFNSVFAAIIYTKKKNVLYTIFPRMIFNLLVCCVQLFSLF